MKGDIIMFEKLQESLATIGMDAQEKKAYTASARYNSDKNKAPINVIDLTGAEVYTGYKETLDALDIHIGDLGYTLDVYVMRHNVAIPTDKVKTSAKSLISFISPRTSDFKIRALVDARFLKLGKKYQAALLIYNICKTYGKDIFASFINDSAIRRAIINGEQYAILDLDTKAYCATAALFGPMTTKKAINLALQMTYKTSKTVIKSIKEELESDLDEALQNEDEEPQPQAQAGPQPA